MKKSAIAGLLSALLISILFSLGCGDSTTPQDNTVKKDTPTAGTNANDVKVDELNKASNLIGKGIDDIAANKRRKDSLKAANAQHTWVYQIGESFEKSDLASDEWNKLKGISNLYIFKKSRREYFLIKDDGYPKELLDDSLGDFKKKLIGIETRVGIIDLGTMCSGKKKPAVSDPVTYKVDGNKMKIDCRECD